MCHVNDGNENNLDMHNTSVLNDCENNDCCVFFDVNGLTRELPTGKFNHDWKSHITELQATCSDFNAWII